MEDGQQIRAYLDWRLSVRETIKQRKSIFSGDSVQKE